MMKEITVKYLTNPVTSQLIIDLENLKEATSKQLAGRNPDIPQASLYRYLKKMLQDGIIEVIRENQIRGLYEKVYALKADFTGNMNTALEGDNGEVYYKYFTLFMRGLLKEFKDFTSSEKIDSETFDRSGFTIDPVYATDQELVNFCTEVRTLIEALEKNESTGERKLRNIALIVSPPRMK